MIYEYRTSGTCSSRIQFEIEEGKLHNVRFTGGCSGNLQGRVAAGRGDAGRRGD
jgi:hypothetical protein